MTLIKTTAIFDKWFKSLRDQRAQARIEIRIRRFSMGNPGDYRYISDGISELRIDYGPGYRIYYCTHGQDIYLLLCGGDKRTQQADIERAKIIAALIHNDNEGEADE